MSYCNYHNSSNFNFSIHHFYNQKLKLLTDSLYHPYDNFISSFVTTKSRWQLHSNSLLFLPKKCFRSVFFREFSGFFLTMRSFSSSTFLCRGLEAADLVRVQLLRGSLWSESRGRGHVHVHGHYRVHDRGRGRVYDRGRDRGRDCESPENNLDNMFKGNFKIKTKRSLCGIITSVLSDEGHTRHEEKWK